jgi:solute carrier family 8 (sodium/calcium exchanger)
MSNETLICEPGMWLPILGEINEDGELQWPRGVLMILYLFGMLWSFAGVGIVADCFMAGIETVTAATHTIKTPGGGSAEVKVWNETVANLTLMALGSSAPEIMLSVIGIMGTDYYAEELGPSTIVGSAAFNLLMIIAYCIVGIPPADAENNETGMRRVSDMGVFTVTGFFSIFAYVWLLIILMVVTPNKVGVEEGVLTFLYFPLVVGLAYGADRNWFKGDKINPNQHILSVAGHEFRAYEASALLKQAGKGASGDMDAEETAAFLTRMAMAQNKPSRAQLRINAMRQLTGGKRVVPKNVGKASDYVSKLPTLDELHETPEVNFASGEYSVLESGGMIAVSVVRLPAKGPFTVKYSTEGVTATAGEDFEAVAGTLEFKDGEEEKEIQIKIKDDDEVEDDETFMVKIAEPSVGIIGPFASTTVTIIDDDEPGEIGIKEKNVSVTVLEKEEKAHVMVSRMNGSAGPISCDYKTTAGTAVEGTDYKPATGTLTFEAGQISKKVDVTIIDTGAYEKNATFTVELTNFKGPETRSKGFADHKTTATVTIVHDAAAKEMVDNVTKMMNMNMEQYNVGSSSWGGQFTEALEIGCEDGETPSTGDYVMHYITVPWKLVFAIIPPTTYGGGWVCFFAALVMVGVTTIIIGDIAALFGCVYGLDKATTAITFVALGTSLPDTFASKSAAVGDDTADAAIGNVTGSNAVNVFLGLGLPWMIAAFKWTGSGPDDVWYAKYGMPVFTDGTDIRMGVDVTADDDESKITWIEGTDVQKCELCAKEVPIGKAAFIMPAGTLGLSVATFCTCALVCFAILVYRRGACGAELGGPPGPAKVHSIILVGLWFTYIVVSILGNKGVIG